MRLTKFRYQHGSSMAEAAITLPVVILVTMAMITTGLAGFSQVAASNAANYGARMGSVAQQQAAGVAAAAAQRSADAAVVGQYSVAARGGGRPGAQIVVEVTWTVPNYFASMSAFFGIASPPEISGTAVSTFRQEGW